MDSENAQPIGGAETGSPLPAEPRPTTVAEMERRKMAALVDSTFAPDGTPTDAYWKMLGLHSNRQTAALESMRKMMVFFTVLTVLGLIAALIIGIIGAVQLSNLVSNLTPSDPFGTSFP